MRSSKELKNFIKSLAILLITLHTLVLQNFTPVYSATCNIKCSSRCAGIDYQNCKCIGCTSSTSSSTSSTSTSSTTSGCVQCLVRPTCRPNEELVPQTCNRCAYCRPRGSSSTSSSSTSGTCNIKCPSRCAGIDYQNCKCIGCTSSTSGSTSSTTSSTTSGCVQCFVRPTCRPNEELVPQTCNKCAYCRPRGSSSTSSSSTSGTCNIKCPSRCAAIDYVNCRCIGCTSSTSGSTSSTSSTTTSSTTSGTCNRVCQFPCYNIDRTTCTCLPLGCNGSSTTSGCVQCFTTPTCKQNEEFFPQTCTRCARCIPRGSSSTTSSTSGGGSSPYCIGKQITCNNGIPTCRNGQKAICGSSVGLKGNLAGPGCIDRGLTSFNPGAAFCSGAFNQARINAENEPSSCDIKKLCPSNRKRFDSCREDKLSCTCNCQFESKGQKHTPICNKHEVADCPKGLTAACSNLNNKPSCHEGKLFCSDPETLSIDLIDTVTCK